MESRLDLDRSSSVPLFADRLELVGLDDKPSDANPRPTTVLLVRTVIPAPDHVADGLGTDRGHPVTRLLRLRFAGNEPMAIMENYLPHEVVDLSAVDLSSTGLYQALRAGGISLTTARQRIGARAGTVQECRLLGEPPHSPMLTVERVTRDRDARVVEYASHLYRASRFDFTMTLIGG